MLVINQGSANTLVVTVTEKSTLPTPYYLFRFISDTGKNETSCIATNISSYKYRYDKFLITEVASPVNLSGQVYLRPSGYWRYEIYEQASSTNLDYTLATTLVERGKVHVIGTGTTYTAYNSQPTTIKVHE